MLDISEKQADQVYDILVDEAGACPDEASRLTFVTGVACNPGHASSETRLISPLGFGGKFRNNDNRPTPYVDCYPEDETPERMAMIERTNIALASFFSRKRSNRTLAEKIVAAAEWLRCNEGDEGDAEDCHDVADWLEAQADKMTNEAILRAAAKQSGLSVQAARSLLKSRNRRTAPVPGTGASS